MVRLSLWMKTREYRMIVMLYLEHRNAKIFKARALKSKEPA